MVSAVSAQAYPELDDSASFVDTDTCPCSLSDTADGTNFEHDENGTALKVQLFLSGAMVGKVEFHPYGEVLWVYDTRNDGDTIYARVWALYDGSWYNDGTYSPPGTDNVIDYTRTNRSYPEGAIVRIQIYDDAGLTDLIADYSGAVA